MAQQAPQVDFTQALNELANRLRVLEGKHGNYAEKMLIMNQNMIEEHQKVMSEIKKVRQEMVGVNKDIGTVKNVIKHLSEEASKFAKSQDVKMLQKYVNHWNPLNFTTEKDVLYLIDDVLGKKGLVHKKIEKMEKELEESLEKRFNLNLGDKKDEKEEEDAE